jgi:hypothetical protein
MGFYPPIDYVGGFSRIADQLVGIPQDMERLKAAQSLQQLRDMEVQTMKQKMQEQQEQKDFQAGLASYISQNQEQLRPGIKTKEVMDTTPPLGGAPEAYPGTTTETVPTPPKRTVSQLISEYPGIYNQPGGLSYLLKLQEQESKNKQEAWKEFQAGASHILGGSSPESIGDWMKIQKSNPYISDILKEKGLLDISVNPRTQKLETTGIEYYKKGDPDPINGKPLPEDTQMEVTRVHQKDGTVAVKKAIPVKDSDPGSEWKLFYKSETDKGTDPDTILAKWDAKEKSRIQVRKTADDAEMKEIKKEGAATRLELDKDRLERKRREDESVVVEPVKKAIKNTRKETGEPIPGRRIPPSDLEEYREGHR